MWDEIKVRFQEEKFGAQIFGFDRTQKKFINDWN
jgi:hypothetical protein